MTVFAFSAENFGRPAAEVSALLALIESTLRAEADALQARGVRLRFIGDLERLPPSLRTLVHLDLTGLAPAVLTALLACRLPLLQLGAPTFARAA